MRSVIFLVYPADEELIIDFFLKPLDSTPTEVEVVVDDVALTILPSYNSTLDMYTITIPPQTDGDHLISVNLETALGSTKTFTEPLFCFTRLRGLTVYTDYGSLTEGGSLQLPPIPYFNISQNGFYLGVTKTAGTNVTVLVEWGDEVTNTDIVPADLYHTYITGGNYVITITVKTPLR